MNNSISTNNEKLVKDIKSVVADAEAILTATADQTGKEVAALRSTLTAKLVDAKKRLITIEEAVIDKAKETAAAADEYVHENPWQSVIIAGGLGFLIGYLSSSRRD
ncbi:MAG TPA: DUF883 family protein [Methylophilaceae bacterium]|jgi:ElaB/YqjD/DUF883 family membrane-anchored ribosome-binding protein